MGIVYYTDGACSRNGSKDATGGFGMICIKDNTDILYQEQQFYNENVTNNRMELKGILAAINHIHNNQYDTGFTIPIIYSDSAYCVNTINSWMYKWAKNNWLKSDNNTPENLDIIQTIYHLKEDLNYQFILEKVAGHAGNKWNEYVDGLATGKIIIKE